jgi:hypothetical protein
MEQHHIEIEIRPDGEVKVHIQGAKGRQCLKYAELFKQIVGVVKQQEMTHEFYEPEPRVALNLEQTQQVHEEEL